MSISLLLIKNAKAAQESSAGYEDDLITDRIAQKWFTRLKERKFELTDSPRSDRPIQFDKNQLQAMIKEPRQTTMELAQKMSSSHVFAARHLPSMGTVHEHATWVPHALEQTPTLLHCQSIRATSGSTKKYSFTVLSPGIKKKVHLHE